MKYEIRAMLRQGKGSIVNISSAYDKVGGPSAAAYVGSKHAMEGITIAIAIAFIASDKASYIIGASQAVDGG
jgi:NAD(P)-dependent dehydrogenase (short-subunit alcohol dehydrogenase family)